MTCARCGHPEAPCNARFVLRRPGEHVQHPGATTVGFNRGPTLNVRLCGRCHWSYRHSGWCRLAAVIWVLGAGLAAGGLTASISAGAIAVTAAVAVLAWLARASPWHIFFSKAAVRRLHPRHGSWNADGYSEAHDV